MPGAGYTRAGAKMFWLLALAQLLFACFLLGVTVFGDALPPQSRLSTASGELRDLRYVQEKSPYIEFRLAGQPLPFDIPSQNGDLESLRKALDSASGRVSVLYDAAHPGSPMFTKSVDFHVAYAVSRGGVDILSYERSARDWHDDQAAGRWLGIAFALGALAFAWNGWRHWRLAGR